MNRLIDWMVAKASRLLVPCDRAVALGDLVELNVTGWRALREIFGMIILQEFELWKNWRPWVALICIACLAGAVLSRLVFAVDVVIGANVRAYWHYRVFMNDATVGDVVLQLSGLFLITFACSWTAGFVLGRLSGRAVWLTGLVLYGVVWQAFPVWLRCIGDLRGGNPLRMAILSLLLPLNLSGDLAFLLPAIMGVRRGLHRQPRRIAGNVDFD